MATNDERLYYLRLSKQGFQGLLVKQAFYDARPVVKTEATEETAAMYYVEADGLSFEQAMRLYKPKSVAIMKEVDGEAPTNLGNLVDNPTIPDEATHVFFAFSSPKIQPLEIVALVGQAAGLDIRQVLIPWGDDKNTYLSTGVLPT